MPYELFTPMTFFARFRRFVIALVLGLVLVSPRLARADEDAASKAAELKKKGDQAMDKPDFATAEESYRKALELTPNDAALHYNLGKVSQARENFPQALDELERFLKDASPELRARVPRILDTLAEVRQRVATLSVTCSETDPDAIVQLGPVQVGKGCSPTAATVRTSIPHGKPDVTLTVTSAKYRAQDVPVKLAPGGAIVVRIDLVPKATSGVLRVTTTPPGASIFIDGKLRGNPPVEVPLAPGSHEVTAKLDLYNDLTVPVIVDLGATKELPLELTKPAPVTKKWWFWTGVVVVVAAAVVIPTVIAANTEKDPIPGKLGTVVAPFSF